MSDDITRRVIEHAQADLSSVGPPTEHQQSWLESAKDWFIDKFAPEVGDMLMQKIAQGSAELSQALNSQSNTYVPYGTPQQPLEVEGPQQSYVDMLREAAERAAPEQDRGLER